MNLTLGLGLPPGSRGAAFSPLSLSPFIWLDPSDLSTMFQDAAMTTPVVADSDPVGAILDKSGNGHHLTQVTAGSRPLYKTSAGLHWLEFDGVDDSIETALAAYSATQPMQRLSAIRTLTIDGSFYHGRPGDSGVFCGLHARNNNQLRLTGTTGDVFVTVGTDPVDLFVEELFNNTSNRISIDDGTLNATGDISANDPTGLGIATDHGAGKSQFRFYGLTQFDRLLTDPEIAQLRTYLASKQGRVL